MEIQISSKPRLSSRIDRADLSEEFIRLDSRSSFPVLADSFVGRREDGGDGGGPGK